VDIDFTNGAPYKIWDDKKRPKFSAIFDNCRILLQIIANISGTDRHIENRKSILPTTFYLLSGEKDWVNFGPLTTKL